MMWSSICILAILAVNIAICQQFPTENDEESLESIQKCFPENSLLLDDFSKFLATKNLPKLSKYEQEFTLTLLKKTYAGMDGSNIFFSPHSIYQALLLTLFISSNHTEYNIKRALQLPSDISKSQVIQAYKLENAFHQMRSLNGSSSYEFNTANRLFVNRDLNIRSCMKELFEQEISPVDYSSDSTQALNLINDWVSRQTKNQINDLLSSSDVSDNTKLIMVNAAYFKGVWQSKFPIEHTRKEVFYITPSRNALIPMMRQKGNFKYTISEKLKSHILQIPYKGNDISMFIILPPFYVPGLESVMSALTPEILEELVEPGSMVERPVEIYIPKFTVEQQIKLVPMLETMGVGDLFQKTADLSALTGNDEIKFNAAIHKAKVSIDEEGTTASAATAIYTFRSSRPLEPIKFICNHPFIYFIYDNISQSILFIGVYNSPVNS